jgi:hypothetical protein
VEDVADAGSGAEDVTFNGESVEDGWSVEGALDSRMERGGSVEGWQARNA